ncbi:MAG: lactonase family protein [Nitrospiria bacterium]
MKAKILGIILSLGMLLMPGFKALAYGPQDADEATGAVYAMTNASEGNKIVIFNRNDDGILKKVSSVSTGGTGSGVGLDPLGSQNSLVLTRDSRWLLAVNGGSNEISVFRVLHDGLELVDKVGSGGTFPVSLTTYQNLVYVLNEGSPNITGFHLNHKGRLTLLPDSIRPLGSGAFAQVGFDPKGERLVVTNKAGSKILVYSVDNDGLPGANPVTSTSNGSTPFGFIFDRMGNLLVVEVGPNAVSSYQILPDNTLQVISGSVPNGQNAACWIAGNERGFVYTANPGSGTVSAYQLTVRYGQLTLLSGEAGYGKDPLDLAVTGNENFLYTLDPGSGNVDMFHIDHNGGLTYLGAASSDGEISLLAQGIAAK